MTSLRALLILAPLSGLAVLAACSDDDPVVSTTVRDDAGTDDDDDRPDSSTGTPDAGEDVGDPTWTNVYAKVVQSSCPGCHTASHETGLDLSSKAKAYEGLVDQEANGELCGNGVRKRVIPGDGENSLFWQKLTGDEPCGDRMPLGGPFLSKARTDLVKSWIDEGALDD